MFCPKCGSEYRPGFDRCADCDLPLVDALPLQIPHVSKELVPAFSTIETSDLWYVASTLNAAGIPNVIEQENGHGLKHVLVPQDRYEDAVTLLESRIPIDLQPDEPDGPDTGAAPQLNSFAQRTSSGDLNAGTRSMNRVDTFVIEPDYDLSIPMQLEPRFNAGGCAGISVACCILIAGVAAGIIPNTVQDQMKELFPVLDIALSLGVGILSMQAVKRRELVKLHEAAKQERILEASEVTQTLTNIYQLSRGLADNLSNSLTEASEHLKRAEREYQENAFGLFWDEAEKAASNISDFQHDLDRISSNAKIYYDSLRARRHSFPVFPVGMDLIPSPAAVIGELRRVVRLGQTNTQCTVILEHRETRKALIAGFRTLGQAIDGLEWAVHSGVDELRTAIQRGRASGTT